MNHLDTIEAVYADGEAFNKSFSTKTENLQLALDSTSLGAFKTCPRLYYYQLILGYAGPKIGSETEENPHLKFGTLYHAASEVYDLSRAKGNDHESAVNAALGCAIADSFDYEHSRPWESSEPTKTLKTLLRTLVWYYDHFEHDPLVTYILPNGKPAVELSFRLNLSDLLPDSSEEYLSPEGEPYSLCGHLDRVVGWNDEFWIVDKKAQPLYSKVLTKDGWIEIRSLKIGDFIATETGEFRAIKSLYPKGITKVFKVEFADDTFTHCAEDHLWTVANDGISNWRTVPFAWLADKVSKGMRFHVPVTGPIDHPEIELELDPYLLGVLLGDGYLGGNSVALSTSNLELIARVSPRIPNGDILRKSPANNLTWTITGNRNCYTLNALRELDLWGCLSRTKFIPKHYLFASINQRTDLLNGLLDTDGSWSGKHRRYQTTSPRLAQGVASLIRSLGGWASILYIDQNGGYYRVNIRMRDLLTGVRKRYIRNISQVEDSKTMCIEIDSYRGLYITDDYIVTHNTTKGMLSDNYFANFNPDNQVSLYSLAGSIVMHHRVEGVIIDAAQIQVGGSRFMRRPISRTPSQLEEWLLDLKVYLRIMEAYARSGYWPMNDKACGLYGGCKFRPICSADPSVREDLLDAFYQKRTWDPLTPR